MNATDTLVLDYLGARAGFTANQIDHLQGWWNAARNGVEPLCVFLLRHELLSESTVQLFRQIAGGYLATPLGYTLVDRRELDEFRRRLPDVAQSGDEDGVPDTVSLLAGHDTAKDNEPSRAEACDNTPPPRVGSLLGKYLLTDWIGKGANGVVFRALHPTLQIPVAVKVLHQLADGSIRANQLKAEAGLLAMLNHPNVVRLYDFEADPQYPFLVLENVNGPNLAELIEHCGRLQPTRAVRVLKQLADGLAVAHRLGIIHRDIKPANVLFTRLGEVKLTDLGLAAVVNGSGQVGESPVPADARVGTANYIAPEMIGSTSPPDKRCDIYSLGATLYHALTGKPPFQADSTWEVIEKQVKSPPPCPREQVPDLSPDLSDLVVRMMAKDPANRPASIEALRQESALSCPSETSSDLGGGHNSSIWRRMLGKLRWRDARRQSA
jgi:tRNA A-37 threonylcarbamoyl transferase component Bud32